MPSEVVVVGAGVFGSAIAFRLAQRKVRVTLIDKNPVGQNASGKNAGNLNPIFMCPPALVPFALESFRLHRHLVNELADIGCPTYHIGPAPRVLLAFNDDEAKEFEKSAQQFKDHRGFSATFLDRQALRNLEPRISSDVLSGLLIEGNMSIDSTGLLRALIDGAKRLGTTYINATVQAVRNKSHRVASILAGDQELQCDAMVLATGPWTDEISRWLGLKLPIKPVKGEMLRLRLNGKKLTHDFTHGSVSLYQRGDEVWIGTTSEDCGFDEVPTDKARDYLWSGAKEIMPAIADAELLEQTAALRAMTPSKLPIVCRADKWENVYLANGGGNKGILICTGVAQAIADLILNGATSLPLPNMDN